MKKTRRLLCLVLTVCMLASMFSMTFGLNIFAEDSTATPETSQTFTFDETGLNDFFGKTYTKSAKSTGAVANPKFTSITDEATLSSYGADQWGLTNLLKIAADKDDTARFSFFANSADYDSAKSVHEAVKQTYKPSSMSTYFSHNTGADTSGTGYLKNSIRGIITGASTATAYYNDTTNSWTGTQYITTFYGYTVAPVYTNNTVKLLVRDFTRTVTEIEYDDESIAAGAVNSITHKTNAQFTGAQTVDVEGVEGVTSQDQLNPIMKLDFAYTGDNAQTVQISYTGKYTVDGETKEFTGTLTDSNAAATDRVFGFWENDVWHHTFAAPAFGETVVNYDVEGVANRQAADEFMNEWYPKWETVDKTSLDAVTEYKNSYVAAKAQLTDDVKALLSDDTALIKQCNAYIARLSSNDRKFRVLTIGNSFSQCASTWLYNLAKSYGYDESNIVVRNMFIGGCTMQQHWHNAKNDIVAYNFENYGGTATTPTEGASTVDVEFTKASIKQALQYDDWDVVVLQMGVETAGQESAFTDGANNENGKSCLDNMIEYVKENALTDYTKVGFHMTWASITDISAAGKEAFGTQENMYNSIINCTKKYVATNDGIDFIIPDGTSVQNARTSECLAEDPVKVSDGIHLAYFSGNYVAGLTYLQTISTALYGDSIDEISKITWCCPKNASQNWISNKQRDILKEAALNAVANPFEVTVSSYQHTVDNWTTVTEATCTTDGEKIGTCSYCGKSVTEKIVSKGHTLGEWEVVKEATVDEPGEEVQKCTVCGEIINKRETGKATTGFSTKDGKTYYYENGEMVKGFKEIDGKTYYFKQDTGVMYKNTLALIGGKLYSFDKDGSLNTNDSHYKIEDDKCYFDGIQVTGWQTIDGNKYYFSPKTGKMTKNYVGLVADTVGSFDENGVYTADENLTIKGQKCYAVTDTTYSNPLTGWQTIYGKQFYFRKTGAYAGNIIVDATKETSKALIGGQIYTFAKAGYLLGE